MIKRDVYLNKIIPFFGSEDIKVITGIRRCGKSMILLQIIDELKSRGIKDENIIFMNFESLKYSSYLDEISLYNYLVPLMKNKKMYLFFDEIQEVKNWEKVINSLRVDFDCDIYISGSNSKLLSGELATYIAGRYVSFTIYPLSYKEVLQFIKVNKLNIKESDALDHYIRYGGFPIIYTDNLGDAEINNRITDIYSSIVLNDIIARKKIRNRELLNRVIQFVLDNIGNVFSANSVSKFFKSQNRKFDIETIYNYLSYLEESFIIKKASRFDLKGKELLETNEKYYVMDLGIRNINVDFNEESISYLLENVIYLELIRRGYEVYIGKINEIKIDFICEKNKIKKYIQVCYKLNDDSTIERELKPLLQVNDNYDKYVITMDKIWNNNYEGIKKISVEEFLLGDEF